MPLYISGRRPLAAPDADGAIDGERTPWWTTPYGRWRLSVEKEAMKRFPSFESARDPHGRIAWLGTLRSSLNPAREYRLLVMYPDEYPDTAPAVYITSPELVPGTPHLLVGNRPCLFTTYGPNGYDPARTTAATLVAWTALWIHAYETWCATGEWPGRSE
jgi:hypothetical protein